MAVSKYDKFLAVVDTTDATINMLYPIYTDTHMWIKLFTRKHKWWTQKQQLKFKGAALHKKYKPERSKALVFGFHES